MLSCSPSLAALLGLGAALLATAHVPDPSNRHGINKPFANPAAPNSDANRSSSETTCANQSPFHKDHDASHQAPLSLGPWHAPPKCVLPKASITHDTEPVCAYVSKTFANGRGIAFLTTPSHITEILTYKAFTDPKLLSGVNRYSNPPFEQRSIPMKGQGLIANKTLYSGDRLFASTPILIVDPAVEKLNRDDRLALSYHAVQSLPEETGALFWGLAAHTDDDPFDDRVDTNSFGIEVAGVDCWVVFPEIARLNHDCRPKAAYFFDLPTLSHHVHITSLTPVPPGTELTISYIDASMTRAKRRAKLKHNWGFPCDCSSCNVPYGVSKASDERLARIDGLVRELGDWRAGSAASVSMAETLVSLIIDERLHSALPDAYTRVSLQYSAQGDKYGAIRWASKAFSAGLLEDGPRAESQYWSRMLLERPEEHWSWRTRVNGGGFEFVEERDGDEDSGPGSLGDDDDDDEPDLLDELD